MLRKWLTEEYFCGPTGVGNENITGVFVSNQRPAVPAVPPDADRCWRQIDDFWCYEKDSDDKCTDPAPGPSEVEPHAVQDMGLSAAEVKEIALGWRDSMEHAHRGLLAKGGWAWDLFPTMPGAGCCPSPAVQRGTCKQTLRKECREWPKAGTLRAKPLLFGLNHSNVSSPVVSERLPELMQNLAAFQLVRGEYAYLGCAHPCLLLLACAVACARAR